MEESHLRTSSKKEDPHHHGQDENFCRSQYVYRRLYKEVAIPSKKGYELSQSSVDQLSIKNGTDTSFKVRSFLTIKTTENDNENSLSNIQSPLRDTCHFTLLFHFHKRQAPCRKLRRRCSPPSRSSLFPLTSKPQKNKTKNEKIKYLT